MKTNWDKGFKIKQKNDKPKNNFKSKKQFIKELVSIIDNLPGYRDFSIVKLDITPNERETILEDEYPIHGSFLYIADNNIVICEQFGSYTVAEFKRRNGIKEFRRLDYGTRVNDENL